MLDKERFRVDEPILVTLVLENVSGEDLFCGTHATNFDYVLYCRDEGGAPVPPTCYGETIAGNRGKGRYWGTTVPPGGHLVDRVLVTRLVDLSLGGKYTLKVAREVRDEPITVSKTCSFEVVEA